NVTSSPFQATWDPTGQPSGAYELRAVIIDAAGNTLATMPTPISLDETPPTIGLGAVPSTLGGSAVLGASSSGGAVKIVYAVRPAGSSDDTAWRTVGTATTSPWSVTFDTNTVPDALYDIRGTAYDQYGNSASDTKTGVR